MDKRLKKALVNIALMFFAIIGILTNISLIIYGWIYEYRKSRIWL